MKDPDHVVISGAAGAWGDSSLSTAQLLADGRSDYIIYEGLAEITMAILARARAKDPTQGYARDIIETIAAHLTDFHQQGIKVITNAGGVNPQAAADVIRTAARKAGVGLSVGVVEGDDLSGMIRELRAAGVVEMNTGEPLPDSPLAFNAYLGAYPIAAALDAGADVVVTGRVVDSALVLGPLIHEFGWDPDDHYVLAAGSLAGHLLECGPQSTGGLFTDWKDTSSWVNPGYPIAEIRRDGSFVLTAPEASDALVDVRTVAEQLLYEIGDPACYLLPDVVCDWSQVELIQKGVNRVEVAGARGMPPTSTLKACAQVQDGWRTQMLLFIGGRDAAAKARRAGEDLVERGRRMLAASGLDDFREVNVEVLGAEDTYGPHARRGDTREVVLKVAVHHDDREAVARFVREIPSIGLAGPPGVSGGGAGLPRPSPLIRLKCFLVPREMVVARVDVDGETVEIVHSASTGHSLAETVVEEGVHPFAPEGETVEVPLIAIAHGRSGDKGADVNIGVRARHPDFLPVLLGQVTAERVSDWLAHLGARAVERYEVVGIDAVNFVLRGGLGAGGTASLRFDPQGKAIAQQLLDMPVQLPTNLADHPALAD
ncbi:MAG: acyclic terpene utilization AtuA family protein [Acidimicrobiia bacterium]